MPSLNDETLTFQNSLACPDSVWRVWILAFRPKTLTAALAPIVVATAIAFQLNHSVKWELALFALISSICIQIGTNLFNDVLDFVKGADTAERIGPRRVTQSGLLSPRTVRVGAFAFFLLAALAGLPLVLHGGWVIVLIGLVSLIMGYAYTGGPYPLAYKGLGDLFVLIFFGWVAVGGMYYLHAGDYGWPAFIAGTQTGLLATVLIAVNNFRDHVQDRKAGKMTLAARFGPRFAKMEIATLLAIAFGLQLYWWFLLSDAFVLLPLVILPWALRLARGIWNSEPGPNTNSYLAQSSVIYLLFGSLFALGLAFAGMPLAGILP